MYLFTCFLFGGVWDNADMTKGHTKPGDLYQPTTSGKRIWRLSKLVNPVNWRGQQKWTRQHTRLRNEHASPWTTWCITCTTCIACVGCRTCKAYIPCMLCNHACIDVCIDACIDAYHRTCVHHTPLHTFTFTCSTYTQVCTYLSTSPAL